MKVNQPRAALAVLLSLVAGAAPSLAQGPALPGPTARPSSTSSELANSTAGDLGRAVRLGSMDPARTLTVVVGLGLRDRPGLDRLIREVNDPRSSAYGHFLNRDQFLARYAPREEDLSAADQHLRDSGLRTSVAPDHTFITATGSVASIERAFDTRIDRFRFAGGVEGFSNSQPLSVPSRLGSVVRGVFGLDSRQVLSSGLARVANGATPAFDPPRLPCGVVGVDCLTRSYGPRELWNAYNMVPVSGGGILNNGAGQTIAILSASGWDATNLRYYESYFGLPQAPVQVTPVGGSCGTTGAPACSAAARNETELDVQVSTGQAPGAGLNVFLGVDSLLTTFVQVYEAWANSGLKNASTSWGACEAIWDLGTGDGAVVISDIFARAAAAGQTLFVASGDYGAMCPGAGEPLLPQALYPATDPNVVGVGGTSLYTDASRNYVQESAWGGYGSGGGGLSVDFARPYFQAGFNPSPKRGVPDIAYDADPLTGFTIYNGSGVRTSGNGGTSAAAPSMAGYYAVQLQWNALNSRPSGFLLPLIYERATPSTRGMIQPGGPATYLHDVSYGSSYGYPALPGYDFATGLGSFVEQNSLSALLP